ncbi:MAG: hypothetical protein M1820_010629 [Bogoriella megaspora]|nr:MAG: hypothetical protein M1820_010629 [Bogoriella megaspora]
MSAKALSNFAQKAKATKNASSKFTGSATAGRRIIPAQSKDADWQVRIDAGHYDEETKKLNVKLQVNSQATSPALREFTKKNSTHADLATGTFDTSAKDKDAEYNRMIDNLSADAKKNLG